MAARPILVVVVGIDGSPSSLGALRIAADLSAAADGALCIVHVEHTPGTVHTAPIEAAAASAMANQLAADQAHLECELALAGRSIPWRFEQRAGNPADELLRAAGDVDATAIVVGRQARRHRRLRIGPESTVDRLLRDADRPIVVVPTTHGN